MMRNLHIPTYDSRFIFATGIASTAAEFDSGSSSNTSGDADVYSSSVSTQRVVAGSSADTNTDTNTDTNINSDTHHAGSDAGNQSNDCILSNSAGVELRDVTSSMGLHSALRIDRQPDCGQLQEWDRGCVPVRPRNLDGVRSGWVPVNST